MQDNNEIFFVKFPKIYENMSNFKAPPKLEWIATEKIDGSNFSVYSNGEETKFAKRTGFLNDEDWFYNYQSISLELSQKANKIYKLIKTKENQNLKFIVIYGELCGGFYPEDINNWKGPVPSRINEKGIVIIPLEKRAVQEGVYYSDKIKHIIFDIALIDSENHITYLEYKEMMNKCKEVGLYYTPILSKGSLKQLLDYSLEFNSTIPSLFGLKCIDNNRAEGIVIRPSIWKGNGEDRPMLKRKNKSFTQFSGDFDCEKVKKNPILSAICLININRLYGVISKVGAKAKEEEIINLFVEDVWSSMWDNGVIIKDYDNVDNFIKKKVTEMVEEYIQNLNNN
jgi:Rnl2 family RNA ligase